jgi:hypothetical protein
MYDTPMVWPLVHRLGRRDTAAGWQERLCRLSTCFLDKSPRLNLRNSAHLTI